MRVNQHIRKLITLVCVVAVVSMSFSPLALADEYTDGLLAGQQAGKSHDTNAFGWSAFWGASFGLLGGLGAFAYYASSNPEPGTSVLIQLSDQDTQYRAGFIEGYKDTAKSKITTASVTGAGVGVLIGLLIASSISSTY